jgi:hypothetical protein
MSDGNTDAAHVEVDDLHYNVARVLGVDVCAACFVQGTEQSAFALVKLDDGDLVEACPICHRGRALEGDDPFVEQRRRWLAEGRS